MKKKRKKSGIRAKDAVRTIVRVGSCFAPRSVLREFLGGQAGVCLALLALVFLLPAQAAKKKSAPEAYALVAGTVFNASGYALPDADVTLTPDPQPDSAPLKVRKLQTVSGQRGEFAFRLPPGAMQYIIGASAKSYRAAQKPVVVQGEDRVDVTFQLDPESK